MFFQVKNTVCRAAVAAAVVSASLSAMAVLTPIQPARAGEAARTDVDFAPYMADLQRRIKKQWYPPRGLESKRIMVSFKVYSDGIVTGLHIDKSSGAPAADRAALEAVEVASPMRPLPLGAPSNVDIQFTFDYNVFNYKPEQILHSIGELEQQSGNHARELAMKYVALGFSYATLDQYDKSHEAYDKGIAMLQQAEGSSSRDLADAMDEEARYLCGRENDFVKARKLLDTAMSAMRPLNDLQRLSKMECDMAQVVEIPQKHYTVAEQLLRRALADASAAKATHEYNVAIGALSGMFVDQGRAGKAASILSDAMEESMSRGADSSREMAMFGGKLIDIYLAAHDLASAERLVDRLSKESEKYAKDSTQYLQSIQFGVMVAEKFNDEQLRQKYRPVYANSMPKASIVASTHGDVHDAGNTSDCTGAANCSPTTIPAENAGNHDTNTAARLNNEGVKLLVAKNYPGAIMLFQDAMKADSSYRLARQNIAIAYNNLGLSLSAKESVDAFHKSLFFEPNNNTTVTNLTQVQHTLGEHVDTAADRSNEAQHCLALKDYVGAVVEYRLSLRLHTDQEIEMKLPDLIRSASQQLLATDDALAR